MNLIWPLVAQAFKSPKRVAVVDDQRQYTYLELVGGAMHLAEQLDAASDKPHVGILLPTSGAFPIALLACWLSRRVAVPLNYLLAQEELAYVINDSGIDTIVTAGRMIEFLGGEQIIPQGVQLLKMEEADFTGVPPLRWPPNPGADELGIILYTSGTSGKPKGVMLTHGNLRHNVDAAIEHAGISEADTFVGVLPQFHSFGLTGLTLLPLRIGAKVAYTARFVPRKVMELVRDHRPGVFMAIPSMYAALLGVKQGGPEEWTSVRLAISGGEPLPAATYERFRERFEVGILEGYGLTETAPITNWSTPSRNRRGAVGPALPNVRIIVVDDKDQPLGPNQEGEVLIAGPNIMAGYYKLPEQTEQAFVTLRDPDAPPDEDGRRSMRRFFRTGDIGKQDEDGFLYITGRKKEMLIIGGENVFPREIEEVLNRHETVSESAVIGKTDGMRGEVPIAFVEMKDGAAFDEPALRSWCRQHLAQFKVPREIRLIEALPRNPTGKIMRRKLSADGDGACQGCHGQRGGARRRVGRAGVLAKPARPTPLADSLRWPWHPSHAL